MTRRTLILAAAVAFILGAVAGVVDAPAPGQDYGQMYKPVPVSQAVVLVELK